LNKLFFVCPIFLFLCLFLSCNSSHVHTFASDLVIEQCCCCCCTFPISHLSKIKNKSPIFARDDLNRSIIESRQNKSQKELFQLERKFAEKLFCFLFCLSILRLLWSLLLWSAAYICIIFKDPIPIASIAIFESKCS